MWNRTYQAMYKRVKSLVKGDTCMIYYNVRKPLYLDTDTSRVVLGTALLQVRDKGLENAMLWPIAFASKILSSVEQ